MGQPVGKKTLVLAWPGACLARAASGLAAVSPARGGPGADRTELGASRPAQQTGRAAQHAGRPALAPGCALAIPFQRGG